MNNPEDEGPCVAGSIDTTYQTQQRDMFSSGLAAEIGVYAFAVWHAIKSHADFKTGKSWPGVRRLMELTGTSTKAVQGALKTLERQHLLRIDRSANTNVYVARERLVVKLGSRVVCTVVVDYVPDSMRETLARLKRATEAGDDLRDKDVWVGVDVIPGPGMELDSHRGVFTAKLRADEVPRQEPVVLPNVNQERQKLKQLTQEIKSKS